MVESNGLIKKLKIALVDILMAQSSTSRNGSFACSTDKHRSRSEDVKPSAKPSGDQLAAVP